MTHKIFDKFFELITHFCKKNVSFSYLYSQNSVFSKNHQAFFYHVQAQLNNQDTHIDYYTINRVEDPEKEIHNLPAWVILGFFAKTFSGDDMDFGNNTPLEIELKSFLINRPWNQKEIQEKVIYAYLVQLLHNTQFNASYPNDLAKALSFVLYNDLNFKKCLYPFADKVVEEFKLFKTCVPPLKEDCNQVFNKTLALIEQLKLSDPLNPEIKEQHKIKKL